MARSADAPVKVSTLRVSGQMSQPSHVGDVATRSEHTKKQHENEAHPTPTRQARRARRNAHRESKMGLISLSPCKLNLAFPSLVPTQCFHAVHSARRIAKRSNAIVFVHSSFNPKTTTTTSTRTSTLAPLTEMKFAPLSLAMALASSVLPQPGGPYSKTPAGTVRPRLSNLCLKTNAVRNNRGKAKRDA